MTRRNPRAGLRASWVPAVAGASIGNATKVLLLYFAATCMTSVGYIDPPKREDLAKIFGVHEQRIAERIHEAKRARLLEQIDGSGVRGQQARYVATLPTSSPRGEEVATVPASGTDNGGFLTGERYPQIGTHTSPVGTGERYTQHARALATATRKRDDHERDTRVERNLVRTERRSDEEVRRDSPLAADFQNRPPKPHTQRSEPSVTAGNPPCQLCGKPNLFAPASIARGICAGCVRVVDAEPAAEVVA